MDGREVGVRVLVAVKFLSSPRRPDQFKRPPSLLSNVYWGVKRLECEADHSPSTRAEVKNIGSIHPLPSTSSWLSAQLSTGTTLPFFCTLLNTSIDQCLQWVYSVLLVSYIEGNAVMYVRLKMFNVKIISV
jgi:hypothetical protein